MAVRSGGYYCVSCGHGGHPEHIRAWFETSSDCAMGCGCRCGELAVAGLTVATLGLGRASASSAAYTITSPRGRVADDVDGDDDGLDDGEDAPPPPPTDRGGDRIGGAGGWGPNRSPVVQGRRSLPSSPSLRGGLVRISHGDSRESFFMELDEGMDGAGGSAIDDDEGDGDGDGGGAGSDDDDDDDRLDTSDDDDGENSDGSF